jgi:hypothetical protein
LGSVGEEATQRSYEQASHVPGGDRSSGRHRELSQPHDEIRGHDGVQQDDRAEAEQPGERRQHGERDRDGYAAQTPGAEIRVRVETVGADRPARDEEPEPEDDDEGSGEQQGREAGGRFGKRTHGYVIEVGER